MTGTRIQARFALVQTSFALGRGNCTDHRSAASAFVVIIKSVAVTVTVTLSVVCATLEPSLRKELSLLDEPVEEVEEEDAAVVDTEAEPEELVRSHACIGISTPAANVHSRVADCSLAVSTSPITMT